MRMDERKLRHNFNQMCLLAIINENLVMIYRIEVCVHCTMYMPFFSSGNVYVSLLAINMDMKIENYQSLQSMKGVYTF